jgi:hypothetical protein
MVPRQGSASGFRIIVITVGFLVRGSKGFRERISPVGPSSRAGFGEASLLDERDERSFRSRREELGEAATAPSPSFSPDRERERSRREDELLLLLVVDVVFSLSFLSSSRGARSRREEPPASPLGYEGGRSSTAAGAAALSSCLLVSRELIRVCSGSGESGDRARRARVGESLFMDVEYEVGFMSRAGAAAGLEGSLLRAFDLELYLLHRLVQGGEWEGETRRKVRLCDAGECVNVRLE